MSLLHKKSFSLLYLDRNSLTYFIEKGQQYTFQFPANTVKELEVVNETDFTKSLNLFIQSQKLPPATVMIILSPEILYEKEFQDAPPVQPKQVESKLQDKQPVVEQPQPILPQSKIGFIEERARNIQIFLDTVPFEEIASKNYKYPKGIKVVATNKRFYETIVSIFTKQMFLIDAVVPFTMLEKEFTATPGMTIDKAKRILKRYELIKHYSLLEENRISFDNTATHEHHIQMTTKITTKREIALVSIFACLLFVLVGMSYITFYSPAKNRKVASLQQPAMQPSSTPTPVPPSPTPVASPSATLKREKIKIVINGGTALQQNLIKQDFLNNGFTNVITKPSTKPASGKALVVFSSLLSTKAKEELLEKIKDNVLKVTVQEATNAEADVIISL